MRVQLKIQILDGVRIRGEVFLRPVIENQAFEMQGKVVNSGIILTSIYVSVRVGIGHRSLTMK